MAEEKTFADRIEEMGEAVTGGFHAVEDGVVGTYKAIEDGVVGSYKKVEDAFVDTFLRHGGETVEEAKARLGGDPTQHQPKHAAEEGDE